MNRVRSLGASFFSKVGEPDYYGRFGFKAHQGLLLQGIPEEYFLARSFGGSVPSGEVTYEPAFSLS